MIWLIWLYNLLLLDIIKQLDITYIVLVFVIHELTPVLFLFQEGIIKRLQINTDYCYLQDPKILAELQEKSEHSLDQRTVTICSGLDLVNITYTPMVSRDPETAKVNILLFSLAVGNFCIYIYKITNQKILLCFSR